jgi:threonine/homoserine/homoserine lactone efflux protein
MVILVEAVPGSQLGLRIIGSIYLLYLALRLAGSGVMKGGSVSKPLNVWEAGVFQFVNPKAWIFAIAVVAAFLPPAMPALIGGLLLTTILTIVMTGTFATWALGGAALSRLLARDGVARFVNLMLAVLLVASVAFLWV